MVYVSLEKFELQMHIFFPLKNAAGGYFSRVFCWLYIKIKP
jgi:hypothetical protein